MFRACPSLGPQVLDGLVSQLAFLAAQLLVTLGQPVLRCRLGRRVVTDRPAYQALESIIPTQSPHVVHRIGVMERQVGRRLGRRLVLVLARRGHASPPPESPPVRSTRRPS